MKEKLTKTQRELLIGSLLGDGHLRPHRDKVVFEFLQSAKRKFYVQWKHEVLGDLACPQIYHNVGEREYYKLATKTHPELTELYNLFYKGGTKSVPEKISKFLTPFAIAVWYMDDGSRSKDAAYFNTQGFTAEEQLLLIKALRRFYIIANLNKDGKYLRLRLLQRCNKRFLELIGSHVLKEFAYKLPAV
jgi:hypothetical protein